MTAGKLETWDGSTTPEEEAANTTLLRAPAAVVASFFLVGAVAAQAVWSNGTIEAAAWSVVRCLAVAFVCVPFLLPSRRFRSGRRVMRTWIVAAAVAASLRSAYLCVSLFPLPAGAWLAAVGVQIALVGVFWLAVYALVWRPPPAGL